MSYAGIFLFITIILLYIIPGESTILVSEIFIDNVLPRLIEMSLPEDHFNRPWSQSRPEPIYKIGYSNFYAYFIYCNRIYAIYFLIKILCFFQRYH